MGAAGSAALLIQDNAERLLVVKPSYKPGWNLPGGRIEEGESPTEAARRETKEEIGLDIRPGLLLAVGWERATANGRPLFIFDGGSLEPTSFELISLQQNELVAVEFVSSERIVELIPLDRRPLLHAAIGALRTRSTAYVELSASAAAFAAGPRTSRSDKSRHESTTGLFGTL
jgi:8-oxo-dGTP pyrophosphatase MutT (NUDIX family)